MDYNTFINTTLNNTYFKIISSNNNGSCCYDSILKLLKKHKIVKPNINTKTLQAQAVNWVIKNKSFYLYEYDLTLEKLVLYTHYFDNFDEYIKNYKIYCADKNKINNNINWGGTPELIALSNIYNVNVNVYIAWSYSKKYNKIIKGTIISNKPRKDCRFKNLLSTKQSINNDNNNLTTINILYTKYKNNSSHFDILIENT